MNHIRFAAVALAFVAAPLAAQPGGIVRLNFDWKPGMRAEVEYEQVRLRTARGEVDSLRVASTYRMDVSAHPGGFAIGYSGTRWTELRATDAVLGRYYEALARTASGGRGRVLITSGGLFLRMEDAQSIAGEVDQALAPLLELGDGPEVRNIRQVAATLASPQVLNTLAEEEWSALVGAWAGGALRIGEPQTVTSSFQTPVFPGVTIPVRLQFRAAGRVRCTPDDAQERCVKLELSSTPDREVMARAMHDFLERAGAPFEEAQAIFAQLNAQAFITLHTEPQTLRPHFLEYRRVLNANPGENAVSQMDTRTFRFRYVP